MTSSRARVDTQGRRSRRALRDALLVVGGAVAGWLLLGTSAQAEEGSLLGGLTGGVNETVVETVSVLERPVAAISAPRPVERATTAVAPAARDVVETTSTLLAPDALSGGHADPSESTPSAPNPLGRVPVVGGLLRTVDDTVPTVGTLLTGAAGAVDNTLGAAVGVVDTLTESPLLRPVAGDQGIVALPRMITLISPDRSTEVVTGRTGLINPLSVEQDIADPVIVPETDRAVMISRAEPEVGPGARVPQRHSGVGEAPEADEPFAPRPGDSDHVPGHATGPGCGSSSGGAGACAVPAVHSRLVCESATPRFVDHDVEFGNGRLVRQPGVRPD